MNINRWIVSQKSTYNQLLISLLTVFGLSSFVTHFWGRIIISIFFLLTNLFAIKTLYLSHYLVLILRFIAGFALLLNLTSIPGNENLSNLLTLGSYIFYCLFMVLAILAISTRLFSETKVDSDILKGGICIYIMLGLLWGLLYSMTIYLDVDAFNYPADYDVDLMFRELMYFSFTTLTTLGYGDITPKSDLAMTLSNLQAIIGQLYPAIFIARLVSLYSHENDHKS